MVAKLQESSCDNESNVKIATNSRQHTTIRSFLLLLIAAGLLFFVNGRWDIPVAAWVGPIFMARFVSSQQLLRGLVACYLTLVLIVLIQLQDTFPIPFINLYIVALVYGGFRFIPYLLDRLLSAKLPGVTATLVLPLAWTAMEYLNSLIGHYGSWGSIAYTQYGNLPLLQLLSITGLSGITFLVVWFASLINWAWGQNFAWPKIAKAVLTYSLVLFLVLLWGGMRLAFFPPQSATVRVASISVDPGNASDIWDYIGQDVHQFDMETMRARTHPLHDTLFSLSEREAQASAQIILWAELNGLTFKIDEPVLIERGRNLARSREIYLVMALAVFTPGQKLMENKAITIDPKGEIVATYCKSNPIPGDPETGGDSIIRSLDTIHGRISQTICYDMDFHRFIQQASRQATDLMVVPALDWPEITPLHTRMATFRAIENGFSLVRQTSRGLSLATDYQGNVLAAMNYFNSSDRVMVCRIPTKGVTTVYSTVGDLFAILCVLTLMIILAIRARLSLLHR
ncbi:MAG: nitrilase-related carbon-nitrogen hydrolase [Acidobacteriota bacterium]